MAAFRTFPRITPYRAKASGTIGPTYLADRSNACPACTRSNWWVGRQTAECGFCGTTLPIAGANASVIHADRQAA